MKRILLTLLLILGTASAPFSSTLAANGTCDYTKAPEAPKGTTDGITIIDSGCRTVVGSIGGFGMNDYMSPRCATMSNKGGTILFWKFFKEATDGQVTFTQEPTSRAEYQFAARADLNGILGQGQGNYLYKSKSDPALYYTMEKTSSFDTGMLDSVQATSHYRVGTDNQYKTFNVLSYENIWDIFNNSSGCDPQFPTLESGTESNGQRFVWRLVVAGHLTLNGEPIKGRGTVIMNLGDKNGPTPEPTKEDPSPKAFPGGPILDTVPTDTDGNFEFSRKYEAGKGLGNEEIWLNTNIEKKVALKFQFTDSNGQKYEAAQILDFDKDFGPMSDQSSEEVRSNTKKSRVINFDFKDESKVDRFSQDGNSTGTSGIGGNDENSDICPSASWTNPGTWFKSSLCGLGLALHYAGKNFITFAMDQLKVVLGLTSPKANYEKDMGY